jgi:hypothetical protein
VTTAYAAIAAIVLAAVLTTTATHYLRAYHRARQLPTITEQEAREHSRPLSNAIITIAPTNPPTKTEEPRCPASP